MTKINNEYTIRIVHPEFGLYYYSYCSVNYNFRSFVFTKDLSKVQTWKTTKFTDKQINMILLKISENKGKIYLSFGSDVKTNIKDIATLSRKKFYYSIDSIDNIRSKISLLKAEEDVEVLKNKLIEYSNQIVKSYKNIKIDNILNCPGSKLNLIDEFIDIQNDFINNVKEYNENTIDYYKCLMILEDSKNYTGLYLDIIDASNNFRKLKMKTLNSIKKIIN